MTSKSHNSSLGTTGGCVRRLLKYALRFKAKETSSAQTDEPSDKNILNGKNEGKDWMLDFDDIDDAV